MGHRRAADQVCHKLVSGLRSRVSCLEPVFTVTHMRLETPGISLGACGFHVGKLRYRQIQSEPAAAAVIAAEQITILLRRIHAIGVCRIESETFNEATIRLRNCPFKSFP